MEAGRVQVHGATGTPGVATAAWPAALLAPAVVLAVDPWGWYPFGPAKHLVVAVLVLGGAAALWPRLASAAPATRVLDLGLRATPWLLVGWMAVAALAGEDGLYAWVGTPERRFGVATWALCAVALAAGRRLHPGEAPPVAAGIAVATAGIGAVAVAEALGWTPGVLDVAGDRHTGTFGSAAYLGAAAALLGPAAAGTALDVSLRCGTRRLAAAGAAGTTLALAGSGARAAWLGVAVALATVAVHRRRALRDHLRRHRRHGLAAVLAATVAGAVLLLATPAGDRLAGTFDDGKGGLSRLDEWSLALDVIATDPLTGAGPEGYRIAVNRYVDSAYEATYGREVQPDRAHSGPLDVAAAGGVPALVLWMWVVIAIVAVAVRAIRGGEPVVAGMGAGLVAHLAGQLLLFPVVELEPLAWLLAGATLSFLPRGPTRVADGTVAGAGAGAPVADAARRRSSPPGRPAPVLVVLLGTAALGVAVLGVREVRADQHAARAAAALGDLDAARAVAHAEAAVGLRPDVLRLHLLHARALEANGHPTTEALVAVEEALELSPGDPIARQEHACLLVVRARNTRLPTHAAAALRTIDRYLVDDPQRAALHTLRAEASTLAAGTALTPADGTPKGP